MIRLNVAPAPSLERIAADLAPPPVRWPSESALYTAVATEAIRVGITRAYLKDQQPVSRRALRHWLEAKLGGALPELFEPDSPLYYDSLIAGGLGGDLDFVGDVLEVPGRGIVPTPPRAVSLGRAFAIVGGTPTRCFQGLAELEVLPFSRLVHGVRADELGPIPIQTAESFLNLDREPGPFLLDAVLGRTPEPQPHAIELTWYAGNQGTYGFRFGERAMPAAVKGRLLAIALARLTPWETRYFLVETRGAQRQWFPIHRGEWKHVCLSFDHACGRPRRATLQLRAGALVGVRMQGPPTATVLKWFILHAARMDGKNKDSASWHLTGAARAMGERVLTGAGFATAYEELA